MQAKTKQRILGVLVLLGAIAVATPFFFNHSVVESNHHSSANATSVKDADYVYDLPLVGPVSKLASSKPVSSKAVEMPLDVSSTDELRAKASKTSEISAHLLRSSRSTYAKTSKTQCTKTCSFHPEEKAVQHKQIRAPSLNHKVTAVQHTQAPHNTRDSSSDQVSLRSRLRPGSEAWVVQIASFAEMNNAERLLHKLKGQGFSAFSTKAKNQQGMNIIRVFVGPYVEKVKAEGSRREVQKQIHLKGITKKYT